MDKYNSCNLHIHHVVAVTTGISEKALDVNKHWTIGQLYLAKENLLKTI